MIKTYKLVRKLRAAGFRNSYWIIRACRKVDLPVSYGMAFAEKESYKGRNLFGSDGVANPVKGGVVTRRRYKAYKKFRRQGLGMQGVGPMQLTYYTLQDRADALGGCWKPRHNLVVGLGHAKGLIKQYGLYDGVRRYNGDGPAAHAYAADWLDKQKHWHNYLTR